MTLPWDRIVSLGRGATEVVIAAPYIKQHSLSRLLERLPYLEYLTCVTRWQAGDISAGVSDTAVRDLVRSSGGTFRLHPALHAKYYRFDGVVLVGSANLTDAGLGLARIHNLEILAPPGSAFDPVAFEQDLMAGSREIDDGEFAAWDAIPVVESSAGAGPDSTLFGWYPTTRDPVDFWRFYSGRRQLLSLDTQRRGEVDLLVLGIPADLDQSRFRNWVSAALLSSAFVVDVRRISPVDEPGAFLELGTDWGLEPGAARYAAETVRTWLAYFLGSS